MSESQDGFLDSWRESLEQGIEALSQRCPDPLIFLERSAARTVLFGPGGVTKAADVCAGGIALETGGETGRSVHLSGLDEESIVQGVRALIQGTVLPVSERRGFSDLFDDFSEDPDVQIRRILSRVPLGIRGARVGIQGKWLESVQDVRIAAAGRPQRVDRRAGRRLRMTVTLARAGRIGEATADWVRRPGRVLDPEAFVAALLERAERRLEAVPSKKGEQTVVFAPGVAGVLVHEMFGHGLEAERGPRDEPIRPALARIGRGPACREIRVLDDPRRGRVPWRVDDEGAPARPVLLVDDGRLTGRLTDRRTCGTSGSGSTGHGRRSSYRSPSLPRMGCTFLPAGNHDPERLLLETGAGVRIRRMSAARTDPIAGEALFQVSDADRIEQGRIGPPLEPFVLRVTLADTLSTLDRPCDDPAFDTCVGTCLKGHQPLAVSVGSPTIRLGVATVL